MLNILLEEDVMLQDNRKKEKLFLNGSEPKQKLDDMLKSKKMATTYMKDVLHFLNSNFWVYDGHMTQVLSDSRSPFYNIPTEWHEHLVNLSSTEVNDVPFGLMKTEWPTSLKKFVTSALELGCMRFLPGRPEIFRSPSERALPSSLIRGMKPKKLQEVEGMARLVSSICTKNGSSFVLDIGAGMGYLDQVLHYRYGLTVIGVDTAFSHGAQERITISSADEQYCALNVSHVAFSLHPTDESMLQLQDMLNKVKQPKHCLCQMELSARQQRERSWVVVALHACGDLTRSILKFYQFCSEVTSVVCLSCCYHKMTPDYFPLSSCLKESIETSCDGHFNTKAALGIYGLRLASQETRARWAATTQEQYLKKIDHTFFRACIEHALDINGIKWKRPQRRIAKSAYQNFQTYCQAALAEHDDLIKHESVKSYTKFEKWKQLIGCLNLLQILLQPVLESLILLDSSCYLNFDQDTKNEVWLETVVEEQWSPRNIAIVAMKIK